MQEVQLHVDGNDFLLALAEGSVCLYNSQSLEDYLRKSSYDNALQLADKIQEAYKTHFSTALNVSADSIAVEILGHVYFEDFIETLGNKIPLKFTDTIVEKISSHCNEINIGEKGHDHNRFFWDLVTPIVKKYFE